MNPSSPPEVVVNNWSPSAAVKLKVPVLVAVARSTTSPDIAVKPKAFDLLVALVEQPGAFLRRDPTGLKSEVRLIVPLGGSERKLAPSHYQDCRPAGPGCVAPIIPVATTDHTAAATTVNRLSIGVPLST